MRASDVILDQHASISAETIDALDPIKLGNGIEVQIEVSRPSGKYIVPDDLVPLLRPITDLSLDPRNARTHSDQNVAEFAKTLARFGQHRAVVARKFDSRVLIGNGLVMAARALHWTHLAVVHVEDSDKESIARALADNRMFEHGAWDEKNLALNLAEITAIPGVDMDGASIMQFDANALEGIGFSRESYDAVLSAAGVPMPGSNFGEAQQPIERMNQMDDGPSPIDPPKIATSRRGDIWIMGDDVTGHRLMCGDSTNHEDVTLLMDGHLAQLVYTDPPWGVDYDGGGKNPREKLAGNDNTNLYGPTGLIASQYSDAKAPMYLWFAGTKSAAVAAAVAAAGYEIRSQIIWNKNVAHFGALTAQYKQKHESAFYCFKKGTPPRWFGPTNEVSVWDCNRSSVNEFHPTQKPVDLAARAIQNSSEAGDVVLDLFMGSAATLIAAHRLLRRGFGMEISPAYCDVGVQRWQALTNQQARLLETDQTFEEVLAERAAASRGGELPDISTKKERAVVGIEAAG